MFGDPETRCREVLAPYAKELARVPRLAWEQFRGLADADRLPLEAMPIQRANVVHAYMLAHANDRLLSLPGVLAVSNSHSISYLIQGEILIRFKRLDEDSLSSNYPTNRALRFNANLSLPGIPATALRVDVGYRLDALAQSIIDVEVVRRTRRRVLWKFSLEAAPEAIVIPIQVSLDEELAPLPAIRARNAAAAAANPMGRQATDDE